MTGTVAAQNNTFTHLLALKSGYLTKQDTRNSPKGVWIRGVQYVTMVMSVQLFIKALNGSLLLSPGMTDREQAEKVLDRKPVGSYLVRLSTKLWGYTVSVKGILYDIVELATFCVKMWTL